MPLYQLPIAVALSASVVLSGIGFLLTKTDDGKIKLPTSVAEDENGEPLHDPFDVTRAEDLVDGTPLNEEQFWSRVSKLYDVNVNVPFSCLAVTFEKTLPHSFVCNHFCTASRLSWLGSR